MASEIHSWLGYTQSMKGASPAKRKSNVWLNLVCFLLPGIIAANPLRLIRYFSSSTVHVPFDWFFLIFREENWHLLVYQTALAVLAAVLLHRATSTTIRSAAISTLSGMLFSIIALSSVFLWIVFVVPEPQDRTSAQPGVAPDPSQLRSFLAPLLRAGELGRCIVARSLAACDNLNEHLLGDN
jgi:hypothetical protein